MESKKVIISAVTQEEYINALNINGQTIIQPLKEDYTSTPNLVQFIANKHFLVDLAVDGQVYMDGHGDKSYPDIIFETILLTLSQNKAMDDYELKINIIIPDFDEKFHQFEMQAIINMLQCNQSLSIASWFLDLFNIEAIFVKSYHVGSILKIIAKSNKPINLRFRP